MDEFLYKKINELFLLLDDNIYIKNLAEIKKQINEEVINLINNYRQYPTIENKKELYKNETFKKYIKNETELNYLIIAINNKLKRKK